MIRAIANLIFILVGIFCLLDMAAETEHHRMVAVFYILDSFEDQGPHLTIQKAEQLRAEAKARHNHQIMKTWRPYAEVQAEYRQALATINHAQPKRSAFKPQGPPCGLWSCRHVGVDPSLVARF